jgi:curli biogenesis system outer membrane secretion channel CsgG
MALTLCLALAVAIALPLFAQNNDRPRIAVLEFENKSDNRGWWNRGSQAMQDVFVTELVKSQKFRVIDRERLDALMREKNLSLSGDVSAATAVQAGQLLGVEYFLVGAVTEYGSTEAGGGGWRARVGKTTFVAAANARIIDAETGEIIWADEARGEDSNVNVRVMGYGGGVDNDERMFDKVMKPVVQELAQSIVSAF